MGRPFERGSRSLPALSSVERHGVWISSRDTSGVHPQAIVSWLIQESAPALVTPGRSDPAGSERAAHRCRPGTFRCSIDRAALGEAAGMVTGLPAPTLRGTFATQPRACEYWARFTVGSPGACHAPRQRPSRLSSRTRTRARRAGGIRVDQPEISPLCRTSPSAGIAKVTALQMHSPLSHPRLTERDLRRRPSPGTLPVGQDCVRQRPRSTILAHPHERPRASHAPEESRCPAARCVVSQRDCLRRADARGARGRHRTYARVSHMDI